MQVGHSAGKDLKEAWMVEIRTEATPTDTVWDTETIIVTANGNMVSTIVSVRGNIMATAIVTVRGDTVATITARGDTVARGHMAAIVRRGKVGAVAEIALVIAEDDDRVVMIEVAGVMNDQGRAPMIIIIMVIIAIMGIVADMVDMATITTIRGIMTRTTTIRGGITNQTIGVTTTTVREDIPAGDMVSNSSNNSNIPTPLRLNVMRLHPSLPPFNNKMQHGSNNPLRLWE
jgi:hypothetical protein